MKIRFEGDSHQIDANTLINYLIHYQAVVEEANRIVGNGDKKVTVRINAVSKGSFVVDVELVESIFKTLFSQDSVGYAASLCAVVGGVYGVYKFFKGRKASPEEIGKAVNVNGNVLNQVVNVYNGPVVREAVSKSFATVAADEPEPNFRGDRPGKGGRGIGFLLLNQGGRYVYRPFLVRFCTFPCAFMRFLFVNCRFLTQKSA